MNAQAACVANPSQLQSDITASSPPPSPTLDRLPWKQPHAPGALPGFVLAAHDEVALGAMPGGV